jgi:hypothetical protein
MLIQTSAVTELSDRGNGAPSARGTMDWIARCSNKRLACSKSNYGPAEGDDVLNSPSVSDDEAFLQAPQPIQHLNPPNKNGISRVAFHEIPDGL